VFDYVFTF